MKQNRLQESVLYYTDIIGKTWEESLEMYFGVQVTKKNIVVAKDFNDILKHQNISPKYNCLNQFSQLNGMLSSQYNTSFTRAS